MGYDLHITRAKYWAENENHKISAEDWLSIVANDDELTLDTNNGPYLANWSGPSSYDQAWFDWFEGDVFSKNPDRAIFEKMLHLAKQLKGKVQGDDGELYKSVDDFPDFSPPVYSKATDFGWWQSIPLYKRKEYIKNAIMYLLIAAVIAAVNLFDIW